MPVNRNALIRFNTIDNCLRNRYRQWTLEDLIEACSDALYEFEGIDKGVSKRTVQMDIQMMRSEKLGYNAPIIVIDRKYYTYEDPDYSITNIPLTEQDLGKLTEVVGILKQFKGFTHFQELSGMVQRLEDKIHTSKTHERAIIDLEKNEGLRGLQFLDTIYQAIAAKKCLKIDYQSFKARQVNSFNFHPALLKEYRNRWFVLGRRKPNNPFVLLALDRIVDVVVSDKELCFFDEDHVAGYFKNVIGVSVNEGEPPQEVLLQFNKTNTPYVITKPLHHTQKIVGNTPDGVIFSITVQLNFELEKEILSFGDNVKVLAPARLRSRIKERLAHAYDLYQTELNENQLKHAGKRLDSRGYIVINSIYSKKEVARIGKAFHHYKLENPLADNKAVYAVRGLLNKIPDMADMVLNHNLKRVLDSIDENLILTKAIYFDKPAQSNWYVTWHQDKTINLKEKVEADGFKAWTKKEESYGVIPPEEILHNTVTVRIHLDDTNDENGVLKVLPGSHRKILEHEELSLITQHSMPTTCDVRAGGIHVMKPLLLHSSSKTVSQKSRRVIHLEFNSCQLPDGLIWAERL